MLFRRKSKSATQAAPISAPAVMAGEPDIPGLGRALWRKKTRIFGFTLLLTATAFAVVNVIAPQFNSETRLLLEARENVFLRAEADKIGDRAMLDTEAVTSQLQVVLSRDLAREVISKEKLAEKPEFDPDKRSSVTKNLLAIFGLGRDPSRMTPEERTLESYYEHLDVYAVEKSRVIAINFRSIDRTLAARVANSIADSYLHMQQAAKQQQTRAAGNWLAGEITKMRKRVEESEAKVEEYRARTNLFAGTNNSSLSSQQLTEINSQISAARGQKADLEARARQLRELLRSGRPIDSSDIANSESMRRLVDQRVALRSQLAEQSTTLLGQHPRIKELRAQIAETDRQILVEGERLARQLENDAKVAGSRLETLSASLDQVKKLASQTNEQDVQLRALEREAKAQRDLLESYLAKYREAAARESINAAPPEARIISRAVPATKPAYPKKVPIVLITAFAALVLSAGFTVTGEMLSANPYAYSAGAPAYAAPAAMAMAPPMMPRVTAPLPPPAPPSPPANAGPMPSRTIEQIANSLRQAGEGGRRVAVVGSARNVGTTYASISLARALAQNSNVVLVDLAFNSPNLSVISTDPAAPGIAELIRGNASFGDIITRDQFSTVQLVATGNVGSDGPALAASPMLATAIEALVHSYNYVVIDVGAASEVAVEQFAPLAQRAVLVAADPANAAARAARDRLVASGFFDVALHTGGARAEAA